MDRGSTGVLTGCGYSLVARDSAAAFQFLFEQARLHPEIDDHTIRNQEDSGEDGDDDLCTVMEGSVAEGSMDDAPPPRPPASTLAPSPVEHVWTPSARLLAHFPPVLRMPFQLLGTWNETTGQVILMKRHSQGEVVYQGVAFLLQPCASPKPNGVRAPVARFHLALQCEFASADLAFTLLEADDDISLPHHGPSGAHQ